MTLNDDSLWLEEHVGCPPLIRLAGKRPLEVGWTFGPRQEPERWRAKLDGHRGNVGMVCGNGIVVVDVDVHKPNVDRSIAELERRGLPATFEARTGSGGRHLIYRADRPVASAPLKGFAGIDIKADGGQIVVAPSTHPDTGRAYEWVNGRTPAVWPAWLDAMCGQPNRPQPREQHQIVSGRQHGYHLEIAIF